MQGTELAAGWGGAERKRVEAVVETLATVRGGAESLAEVAHDARNMVTALGLYCDLLEEPGVLSAPFVHYGNELRLVVAASRRLVEKLVALDTLQALGTGSTLNSLRDPGKRPVHSASASGARPFQRWDLMPAIPIDNLASELLANRNLLAALAGPAIALTVETEGGALPIRLTGEDLTRVLVNLVKNAAEAMPAGGRVQLRLREMPVASGAPAVLSLTLDDVGPGVPVRALEKIFEAGFSTRANSFSETGWPASHRGLGLSITRSIIEAAGGRIKALNRQPAGARFEIELPVRAG